MNLEQLLNEFPRVVLTRTPTPLQSLPRVSERLGSQILIKRDDLTDLALGGDKPRKLEYELARALSEGADTLVTVGSAQSNHARLTTAAARRCGLDVVVVLSEDERMATQGNLLTVQLMGADIRWVSADKVRDHWDLEAHMTKVCQELEAKGCHPYAIPVSGTTPLSCLGYVRGTLELLAQLEALDVAPDAIYTPFGTGGTYTAILLTLRSLGKDWPVIGISVNQTEPRCHELFDQWRVGLGKLLPALDIPRSDCEPMEIHDSFVGREYGDAPPACLEAIVVLAKAEGILLDPVYSGKVFSGLIQHCREGRWSDDDRLLFLHTGGVPALFAYHEDIQKYLSKGP